MIFPEESYMLKVEGALQFAIHQLEALEEELLNNRSTQLREKIRAIIEDCPQIAPLCRLKVSSEKNHLLRFKSIINISIDQFRLLDPDIELGKNILICSFATHLRNFLSTRNYTDLRILRPLGLNKYNQQDFTNKIKKQYTGKIDKILNSDDPATIIANVKWADTVITDCWGINKVEQNSFQVHVSPVAELTVLMASGRLIPYIYLVASTSQIGEFRHLEGEPVSLDCFKSGVITETGLWWPYSHREE